VTEVRSPTGFITQATYDSLGHIETSTEVQPLGTTANAVTQYVWDPALDVVTQVTPPVGDATTFGYDSLGNRLWQQTGSLGSRRVNFRYNAQGRYVATEAPLTWRDSVVYGALGNVDSVRAENGGWMSYERDAIGRDTLVRSTIDTGKTGTIRRVYDTMGRDSIVVTAGPEMSFAFECTQCSGRAVPAESLTVTTSRDREGRIISIDPKGAPSAPGVDILQSSFVLDPAGRRLKEHHPGFAETYTYDGAGNVVQTVTARNDTVLAAYDALNRLQQRIVPAATYPAVACTASAEVPCNLQTTYAGYQVPRDTAAYLYDADGHLVQADNRDAHVARSYYSNGLLKSDTLRLARWDRTGFASHVYGLVYTYDLAGRRLTMTHPGSILPGAQTSYSYATWGPLDGMTATFGPGHSFSWVFRTDDAGRPSSLTMPGNLTADFAYDSAGQFVRRQLGALFNDTLTYDLRGKLRVADMRWGDGTFTSWYSGLGMLVGARWERGNGVTVDEYRADAHGNTFWTWKRDALGIDTTWNQHSAMALLEAYRSNSPTAVKRREGYRGYDAANNVQYATDDRWTNGNPSRDAGRSYYGADQKLRRVERYLGGGGTPRVSLFRYDALGRRVVTMDSGCAADCDNAITRAVWDGDELLYELRGGIATPEVATGTGTKYGAVGYVHGLTIDQPIGLYRMGFTTGDQFIVPHANFRGHFVRGTDSTGANCCSGVNWPAPSMGAFLEGAPGPSDWIGSLIQDQRDMSGLLYRRNRYYDPATGRFTQQDPIGLAGGLNLFGFAGGDPVSYSDPFGLCLVCVVYAAYEVGSSLYDAYDLAKTGINYLRGKASKTELAVTAAGAGVGLVSVGGGFGRAARSLVGDAVSDPRLWKKLAFEELLSDAKQGVGGRVIAGAGHSRKIDDVARLTSQHGGDAGDWAKVAGQTRTGPGGISQQVHWYENVKTGQRVEFKPTNPY
jgi:RHS repeat-associated protein